MSGIHSKGFKESLKRKSGENHESASAPIQLLQSSSSLRMQAKFKSETTSTLYRVAIKNNARNSLLLMQHSIPDLTIVRRAPSIHLPASSPDVPYSLD